ncbi:hypothetical protein TD95_004386 [Thielaviopsis punctulata]|uniref:BSD domain-containing protein n=1 Tax=Thielaviopsis punctulata TaxID=72032 RepID=A0A0F4ZI39_9PEZI|nr:hypothetical protein TD95_004386 [Thielaviopsis punctulata]
MDVAYDHIQEDIYRKDDPTDKAPAGDKSQSEKQQEAQASLNSDIQEAYKAISSSAWGAKIGGFFGTVVKQGESVYQSAQKELTTVGGEATRGLSDLRETIINSTRNISLNNNSSATVAADGSTTPTASSSKDRSLDSAPSDGDLLSRLKQEAAKRLKDIQRAEDAADAALLQFGSNVRDFLKEAITVAPPASGDSAAGASAAGVTGDAASGGSNVLFESKDAQGKRVIHSTRFEAQLHVLHTNPDTLLKAPEQSEQFDEWRGQTEDGHGFDVDKKTEQVAEDLAKYPELRATMEALVPEKVSYAEFWCRYYFLRHIIETAENRRKELLKAAAANDEVDTWDDDSEDEDLDSKASGSDSGADKKKKTPVKAARPVSAGSAKTIQSSAAAQSKTESKTAETAPKAGEGDSDTSYDVVGAASGVPSHAPSKASKDESSEEESEEEDWE